MGNMPIYQMIALPLVVAFLLMVVCAALVLPIGAQWIAVACVPVIAVIIWFLWGVYAWGHWRHND